LLLLLLVTAVLLGLGATVSEFRELLHKEHVSAHTWLPESITVQRSCRAMSPDGPCYCRSWMDVPV